MKIFLIGLFLGFTVHGFSYEDEDVVGELTDNDFSEGTRALWANITQEGGYFCEDILKDTFDDTEKSVLETYLKERASFLLVLKEIRSGNLAKSAYELQYKEYNTVYGNDYMKDIKDLRKKSDFRLFTKGIFGYLALGLVERAGERCKTDPNKSFLTPAVTISSIFADKAVKAWPTSIKPNKLLKSIKPLF